MVGVPMVLPAASLHGFAPSPKPQLTDRQVMMHSNETARDDSVFENVVGVMAAVSVLCFMGLLLFI
jgi:hypothetical protein